jgi:hypothetical protein
VNVRGTYCGRVQVKAYSGANLLGFSKRKIRQSSITLEKLTPRETYLREIVVESEAGIAVHGIELELERPKRRLSIIVYME